MLPEPKFTVPSDWLKIKTIDMHTGGEPLRIIVDGLPEIKGNTILEKRRFFQENYDYVRTGLMWEPRGHTNMYGAVLTDPVSPGADFGVIFLHNEGYSTMCGHGIIALTKFAIETGMVKKSIDDPELIIDTPAGQIVALGELSGGKVIRSSFLNVPSFVFLDDEVIHLDGIGRVRFAIAFGGAFYVITDAEACGLKLLPEEHLKIADLGMRIKLAVMGKYPVRHPFEEDLSFLYGTIFTAPPENPENSSRNACVFANGELDRSATGTGVSARAALHHYRGELPQGYRITIESIIGTTMDVSIQEVTQYGPYKAVIPEVSGTSYFTGENEFWFDPDDPLKEGFHLF